MPKVHHTPPEKHFFFFFISIICYSFTKSFYSFFKFHPTGILRSSGKSAGPLQTSKTVKQMTLKHRQKHIKRIPKIIDHANNYYFWFPLKKLHTEGRRLTEPNGLKNGRRRLIRYFTKTQSLRGFALRTKGGRRQQCFKAGSLQHPLSIC